MPTSTHTDFLIIGAGPVGLMLALALRTAHHTVQIAEQTPSRAARSPHSKALSLNAGTLETFRAFSLDEPVMRAGKPLHHVDFGLLPPLVRFSPEVLGLKHSHNLVLSQRRTEDLLLGVCEERGVVVRWELRFDGVEERGEGVVARFTDVAAEGDEGVVSAREVVIESEWLIGCDGTQSAVRKSVGIDFPGTAASAYSWLADVRFATPGPPFAFKRGPRGPVLLIGLEDQDTYRVIGFFQKNSRPAEVPSLDEISLWLREAMGTDFGLHDPLWTSVVGNASRVAETFRSGRVFLAGDAAHQHYPAGGQGVNLGIQDAVNLAWKLASVHEGTVAAGAVAERVLDSYSTERKHAAHTTIRLVEAQTSLIFSTAPMELAVGDVLSECLRHADLNREFALKLTGFDNAISTAFRHGMFEHGAGGKDDDLLGSRMTHLRPVAYEEDKFTVKALGNRLTLVLLHEQETLREAVESWLPLLNVYHNLKLAVGGKWDGVVAFLLRPDLHIAWVYRQEHDLTDAVVSLRHMLAWWLGDRP